MLPGGYAGELIQDSGMQAGMGGGGWRGRFRPTKEGGGGPGVAGRINRTLTLERSLWQCDYLLIDRAVRQVEISVPPGWASWGHVRDMGLEILE